MDPLKKDLPMIDSKEQVNLKQNEGGIDKSEEQKDLEEKLDKIEGSLTFLRGYGSSLDKGVKKLNESIEDDEDKKEIKNLQEKLEGLKKKYTAFFKDGKIVKSELDDLKSGIEDLQKSVDTEEYNTGIEYNEETKNSTKLKYDTEKLKNLNNSDFLSIKPENRLQYITTNNIDSESIANGSINDLEFSFTFDGQFNKELYLQTTAGQVLPKEVREVSIGGKKYERMGMNGEFYNGNERLKIKEGTKIDISKIGTKEELDSLKEGNNKIVDDFITENPSLYK